MSAAEQSSIPVHLHRTVDNHAGVDALAELLGGPGGGRTGLGPVLADLHRRARRTWAPGRAVQRALAFDAADQSDRRWWPQGVTTSADASASGTVAGRRVVAVAWYAKQRPEDPEDLVGGLGVRVSLLDLDTRRYRHLLLVVPEVIGGDVQLTPLRAHAGGLVWHGPLLYVAATARGLFTCSFDDVMRVPDRLRGDPRRVGIDRGRISTGGYRYLLPVRAAYQAHSAEGTERLRYSFLSLDRGGTSHALVAGEYARGAKSRRLVRYPLDPDTGWLLTDADEVARPVLLGEGVQQMQGAVRARGRWHVTASHGPWMPGSVYVGASPGTLGQHRFATPMGPEDVSYWPAQDLLWSVTEHPHRRWVYAMRRSWFD